MYETDVVAAVADAELVDSCVRTGIGRRGDREIGHQRARFPVADGGGARALKNMYETDVVAAVANAELVDSCVRTGIGRRGDREIGR